MGFPPPSTNQAIVYNAKLKDIMTVLEERIRDMESAISSLKNEVDSDRDLIGTREQEILIIKIQDGELERSVRLQTEQEL